MDQRTVWRNRTWRNHNLLIAPDWRIPSALTPRSWDHTLASVACGNEAVRLRQWLLERVKPFAAYKQMSIKFSHINSYTKQHRAHHIEGKKSKRKGTNMRPFPLFHNSHIHDIQPYSTHIPNFSMRRNHIYSFSYHNLRTEKKSNMPFRMENL